MAARKTDKPGMDTAARHNATLCPKSTDAPKETCGDAGEEGLVMPQVM